MMERLLELQKELDDVIVAELDLSDKDRLGYCATALMVETAEFANEIRHFKFWSKKGSNQHKAKEELMDVLHFWMSIANQMGLSADDIYAEYEKKRQINFNRQKEGY